MLLQRIALPDAPKFDDAAPPRARSMADHWDDLAADASEPNVFAERWFVEAGLRHMAAPGSVRTIPVWSDGGETLIGLLPLRIAGRYGRTPVRHVQNWVHDHAFLGTPLVRRGRERAFWTGLLAAVDAAPWAPGFLHLTGMAEDGPVHRGLAEAAAALGRPCAVVHRMRRAMLEAGQTPQAYYEAAVRKKKRKELGRLRSRLAELGDVRFETLERAEDAPLWCEDFLSLEAAGWKGKDGSALANAPSTAAFFREMFEGAFRAGKLEILRLAVDEKPIAMLVNLHAAGGGFSYKIAFDEDYARYSPGVMIEIENLRLLARPGFAWMDSCAAEDHPMIDSLWMERRSIVRLTVPLSGARRAATFRICRALEQGSALVRRLRKSRNV
ncbi:MAG TPA: GNAT family N-acetyltransferase [Allosphingosinicella sp.]|jgi:CelD/BcsL family acetyltransferase involved in cellulose biosynthesis